MTHHWFYAMMINLARARSGARLNFLMTIPQAVLLFFAALAAGVLNSVAGGGSFISFPVLLFTGVPPIPANATSSMALWPGTVASAGAYRRKVPHKFRILIPLIAASFAGGIVGAKLLLHTPGETFLRLIPFLFLAATLLFVFSGRLLQGAREAALERGRASWTAIAAITTVQFCISIYGGFFGGGMGVLMLSFLSFLPLGDIHAMNGVKTLLASTTNAIAIAAFIFARIILWPQAVVMLFGAALGGYGGARYAQKVDPKKVKAVVVIVGFTLSFYFLWKYH